MLWYLLGILSLVSLLMGLWCVVAVVLGKWVVKLLAFQYEKRWNRRNAMTEYPHHSIKDRYHKTRLDISVNTENKSLVNSVTKNLPNIEDNDSNQQSDKHGGSLTH